MKALRFAKFGSLSEAVHMEDLPDPRPAENEILVRIEAAGINPSDTKNIQGKMEGTVLPRTPGRDFAGVVVSGPPKWIGREVWGSGGDIGFTRDGAHAEQIILPESGVALKPAGLSMAEAAAVGTNYITAYLGLIEIAKVKPGEWVLVTGATGGVGSSVIQLATWRGARVIAVDRGGRNEQFAADYNVDLMLEANAAFPGRVKEITGGHGADVAYDCVGGPLFEPCLQSLGHLGRQINITSVAARRVSFDLLDFYHRRLALFGVDSRAYDTVACARILEQLAPGFESGKLRSPRIAETVPLASFADAYQKVDSGSAGGKVVFTFQHKSTSAPR